MVALLEACYVTINDSHLGFYQELKIRLKPQEVERRKKLKKKIKEVERSCVSSKKKGLTTCYL